MLKRRKKRIEQEQGRFKKYFMNRRKRQDKGCLTDGHAFWGSGPCCDVSEGEKGQTRSYALLSGHFPQSADEGNHPVALRRAEFSTHSSFFPSHIFYLPFSPSFSCFFVQSLHLSLPYLHFYLFCRLLFLSRVSFFLYSFLFRQMYIHIYIYTYAYIYI